LKVAKEKAEQSDKIKSELLDQIKQLKNQKNNNLRMDELTDQQTEIILNNGTILYVKDKLSNVQLVEQILEEHRSTIRLVTNMYGKNTVQFAIDYTPDLILLDLSLPDIHGSEVIKLLQTEPRTAEIPVIILSEYAMSVQIEKIIAAGGAKNYLIKPIDKDQFLKIVDEWIRKSSKELEAG